jgi:hypothetical protein
MSLVSVASNGTQKDLPGLLEKLNYRDSLHQWDVMVAYSEDTVNSILQTSHAKVMEQLKNDGKPDFFQSIRLEVDEISKSLLLPCLTAWPIHTFN